MPGVETYSFSMTVGIARAANGAPKTQTTGARSRHSAPAARGGANHGNEFPRMALATAGSPLCGAGGRAGPGGVVIPGLPLASVRNAAGERAGEMKPLEAEVQNLRVYKQRRAELQSEMDALQKQLATLQTIVPEEKADRSVHLDGAARGPEFGSCYPNADRKADCSEALLLRDAVSDRGGRSVLLGAGFFLEPRAPLSNHQCGRPEADFGRGNSPAQPGSSTWYPELR